MTTKAITSRAITILGLQQVKHILALLLATRTMLSPFEGLRLCFGSGKSLQLSHMTAVEIISVRHLHFRAMQQSNETPSILRPVVCNAVSLLFGSP